MAHHLGRATLAVALAVGLASCGAQASKLRSTSSLTAYARNVGAADAFTGRMVRGTGRLTGDRASVRFDLHVGSSSRTRKLSMVLTSPPCHGGRHCLSLTGTLKGALVRMAGLPDRGRTFALSASGTLKPLARATATGTVTGTGNIRFGHESLVLTLSTREGQLFLAAQSGQVPGFTSP